VRLRHEYPRPALTVDVVLLTGDDLEMKVLLIQRGQEPFKGRWALPGGFVDEMERLEDAAARELEEETGLRPHVGLMQLAAYGDPGRDPRGWTVSVAFVGQLDETQEPIAGDDAAQADWFLVWDLPRLAFDHEVIIEDAIRRVRSIHG